MDRGAAVVDRLRDALAGRYDVERELGAGGMALVFLAHDVRHSRAVALKVLRPELSAAVGPERFLREIRLAATLSHPHILPLHDSGDADGLLYYVMPLVDGGSLRDRLEQEGRIGGDAAVEIGRAVALALDYAHRHGVVHRDIKPDNIMVHDGVALVADFGIGKAVSDLAEEALTMTGMAIGTPAYMSPEQVAGDTALDGRSDLYSLGCVLYELLTGQMPFRGATPLAVMAKRVTDPAPRLVTLAPEVPPALERVVRKVLATDPGDRYATGADLARALLATRGGGPLEPEASTSIAVLPLDNMSADPDNEYLSDGISEELTHALARLSQLRVVARTSAFAFKGRHTDVREVGERLNVASLLVGSVRRAGDQVRVTVQLVDTATGFERWSARYDRQMADVFVLQDEIAGEIVDALKATLLGGAAAPRAAAVDAAVSESYLRGRHALSRRTEQSLAEAVQHLGGAVAANPAFAAAHSALAEAYILQALYGAEPPSRVTPLARAAAERALALDGTAAEALTSLGCLKAIFEWQWQAAAADFQRALALRPSYAAAHHWMGINLLAPQGRFEEALAALGRARELDPVSPAVAVAVGVVLFVARDYACAAESLEEIVAQHPDFPLAHYFLGQTYVEMERVGAGLDALRHAAAVAGRSNETLAVLGYALGQAGERAEAIGLHRELLERAATRYVSPVHLAWAALGAGDPAEALRRLREGAGAQAAELAWLGVRPQFDPLRSEPAFAELQAAVLPGT